MFQDFKPESALAVDMARLWELAQQFKDAAVTTGSQVLHKTP